MDNITDKGKYQCVRGNHEQLAIDWLADTKEPYYVDFDKVFKKYISDDDKKHRINVDGGCCYFPFNGQPCMLCALCLETLEEIYSHDLDARMLEGVKLLAKGENDINVLLTSNNHRYIADKEESEYRRELLDKYYS